MPQDVAFPLQAVGEAAAAELAGETLLAAAAAAVGAAGGRRKGFWETEFRSVSRRCSVCTTAVTLSAPASASGQSCGLLAGHVTQQSCSGSA